jgi:hypothetical protein
MKSCCKDVLNNDTPETPQDKKNRLGKWFKRIGIAGFLFFLLKGIVWLFVIYGGLHVAGC